MSINEDNFELKAIIDRRFSLFFYQFCFYLKNNKKNKLIKQNYRCLCEISKIIGFDDTKALKSYEILGNNSFCRNLVIHFFNSKLLNNFLIHLKLLGNQISK